MKYDFNWEERIKQAEAFWNKEYINRCSLNIAVRNKGFKSIAGQFSPVERFTNPEVVDKITRHMFDNTTFCAEAMPAKYVDFGTSAQCEYFGSKAEYEQTTAWFNPALDEPDASLMKDFDIKTNEAFLRQKKFISDLVKLSNDDYIVSMTDNCGNIDALAALRGSENLMMDMFDDEDFVTEATNKLIDAWNLSEHEFYNIIKKNNHNGCTHGWMQVWAPGIHTQLQCDFSVMVSPSTFEQFALPELQRCAKAMDYCSYHLDGIEEVRHLDMILSVKEINNVQWTPVAGQPKTSENIETLQKIQKAGKGLILGPKLDEVEFLLNNLSHDGLHMNIHGVSTVEDANDLIRLAEKCAHR